MFPSGRQVAEVAEELEEVSLMVHHQVGVAAENLQQLLRYHPAINGGTKGGGGGGGQTGTVLVDSGVACSPRQETINSVSFV